MTLQFQDFGSTVKANNKPNPPQGAGSEIPQAMRTETEVQSVVLQKFSFHLKEKLIRKHYLRNRTF